MRSLHLILLLFLFPLLSSAQNVLTGRVVKIADGDTFTLLVDGKEQVKVRLDGIDAPEKKQAYGNQSKEFLSSMIWNVDSVVISISRKDRYGRSIAKVSTPVISDVNYEMIKAGLAWHYKDYSRDEHYAEAEIHARQQHLGLWKDPNPIRPQDFRKHR